MKRLALVLSMFMFVSLLYSCTKRSGCKMVEGTYVTGEYEYLSEPMQIMNGNTVVAETRGMITSDDGYIIALKEKSIPSSYRKNGMKKRVAATFIDDSEITLLNEVKSTFMGYYKLRCIENIE